MTLYYPAVPSTILGQVGESQLKLNYIAFILSGCKYSVHLILQEIFKQD